MSATEGETASAAASTSWSAAGAGEAILQALRQRSLCAAFQVTARANASLPALRVAGAEDAVSWREYAARVEAVACGLHALGLRAGDVVALLLRNRPTFNIVDMAALHLGAIPFSIYHTEPVAQMQALLEDSGAQVLVSEPAFEAQVAELMKRARRLRHVAIDGEDSTGDGRLVPLSEVEAMRSGDFDFTASWRSLGPDAIATRSALIAHVVAIGDRRRYVTALIVLDPAETAAFAAARGRSGSPAELAADPAVQAEVERAVAAGNELLARVEHVRAWRLLADVWEPGGQELTNTLKLRRGAIAERYAAQIEALYAED